MATQELMDQLMQFTYEENEKDLAEMTKYCPQLKDGALPENIKNMIMQNLLQIAEGLLQIKAFFSRETTIII